MSALITGDLHLTTNPQDEYRWKLFDWLCEQSQKHDARELILLGDYTNPKDNHPAQLVNAFVSCILMCSEVFDTVVLIAGNHDYIDPNCPFFQFIDRKDSGIFFIKNPKDFALSIGHCLFVPAGTDWLEISDIVDDSFTYIFTHATFDGAISETGHGLTGVSPKIVEELEIPVISGDIHKPQKIGKWIEYVGSPYHTRFGSDYEPHIMLLHDDGVRDYLKFPAPLKHTLTITSLDDLDKIPDNSINHHKIRVHLSRGEIANWSEIQQNIKHLAKEKGINITGPELILNPENKSVPSELSEVRSPEQLVEDYAKRYNASDEHITIGKALLGG